MEWRGREPAGGVEIEAAGVVSAAPFFGDEGQLAGRADLPMLMEMQNAGKLLLDEFITRRDRLDQINEAYEALIKGEVAWSLIVF